MEAKPPIRFRKLRIAWSVACGIACVFLIVLWVRGYWCVDRVTVFMPGFRYVSVRATWGCIEIGEFRNDHPMNWHVFLDSDSMANSIMPRFHYLGFRFGEDAGGYTIYAFPIWFSAIFMMLCSTAVWLPWQCSLRTLLIVTTLVAVVLGLAVWVARN